MNKPTVTIKEKQYLVTQISVVLKLNSGSLIYLRLSDKLDSTANKPSNEETITKEFVQQIFEEQEGTFQWLGATIKFILTGYNSFESTTFELVGLVIRKDLITWFNDNDFKNKKQDYLIYQKVKTKNAWPFFSQVLGEKFDKPNQDFIDKINFLFPENGCIWRHRDSENFKFLNKALTFANRHVPEVKGWCAFDADKPLRLILFEEKKQDQTIPKLDQTWVPKSYPFLPNQYNWNYEFKSSCTLSRELSINNGQEPALIKQLVSDGNNGESDQKGKNFQAQNPVRLLFAPGTVAVAGRNIFCHTVTYEFKLPAFGDEPPTITMKLELDYPRESGDNEILSLRLLGNFKKWRLPKDEETEIEVAPTRFNANITNWGIIDEKTQKLKVGAKAVLYTQILSPTYSNKKYSGIYIKHEKNDEMIIDIQPCGVPLVLGSIQKYRQQLEKANVTLCGKKLAISVSPHNQKLSGAEAIVLDNKQIKLNHEKVISGQAQRAVNFLSKNLKLGSSRIQIKSGQTTINSAVNISTPAPQIPKPNPKAPTATSARTPNQTGAATKPPVNIQKDNTIETRGLRGGTKSSNSSSPSQNIALFSLMNDSTIQKFVKDDKKAEYQNLIHQLPQNINNLDDLENFADVANQIYDNFDFAQRNQELQDKQTDTMGRWAAQLQAELYQQRDKMLKNNPNEIQKYSLQNQFKNKFPDENIPPELAKIDIDKNLLIFSLPSKSNKNPNQNDCGVFANKLFQMRKNQIEAEAKNSNSPGDLKSRKDVQETNKIKIQYHESQETAYPHHFKTSLTGNGNNSPIYTLEANTGKPFLLSPELQKYNSREDFEEKQNPTVKRTQLTRMEESIAR